MVDSASTRQAYGKVLVELGHEDPDIVVLGGDLNKSTAIWDFAKEFPDRFFDLGAAEQNIMSVAAGFAAAGKIPFVSTFAVFSTSRPFDQLRVGVAQPHLNVKLVATHAGLLTGEDGMSAQGIEDISLAASLVGFNVVVPADAIETVTAIRAVASTYGPCYVRLSRPATPVVHEGDCKMVLGKAELMNAGNDVTIAACGVMVSRALEAAAVLAQEGIAARVLNVHTLSPIDVETIVDAAEQTGALVTAEEHLRHGGLGSIIGLVLGEHCPTPLEMIALTGYAESGRDQELLETYGLTAVKIAQAAKKALNRKSGRR